MDRAKIQLSADELHLVTDEQVILTKNRVIGKMLGFFGLLVNSYRGIAADIIPPGIGQHPKISRGENYNGLPWYWIIKTFHEDDLFAFVACSCGEQF